MYKFTTDVRYSKLELGQKDPDSARWFIVCKTVGKVTPDQRKVGMFKSFICKPTARQVTATKKAFRKILRGMYAVSN